LIDNIADNPNMFTVVSTMGFFGLKECLDYASGTLDYFDICCGLRILLGRVEMKLQREQAYTGASLGKKLEMGFVAFRMNPTLLQ
jgi:hypothetical protein